MTEQPRRQLLADSIEVHNLLERTISAAFTKRLADGNWRAVVTGLLGSQYAHHRAVLRLVDDGMARQAMPIVRTNFEAAVAVTWMCAPASLVPTENGRPLASPRKPKRLSHAFRANCYMASRLQHSQRLIEGTSSPDSIYEKIEVPDHIASQLKAVSARIGAEWMKRIERRKSYSGLTFKDTCDSLSFLGLHNSTYRTHSLPAHAGDALDYATLQADGSIALNLDPSSSNSSARSALGISSTVLLMSIINASRFKNRTLRDDAHGLLRRLKRPTSDRQGRGE